MAHNNKRTMIQIFIFCMLMVLSTTEVHAIIIQKDSNTSETQITLLDTQDTEPDKIIIGRTENIHINPGNMIVPARIDTGATTTSLGIDDMQIINEDGTEWVEGKVNDSVVKFKVLKYIRIKRHGAKSIRRPVTRLKLTLGDVSETVNVTVADRSKFKYQLLIGRNYLYDHFIVDVSLKNTISHQKFKEK